METHQTLRDLFIKHMAKGHYDQIIATSELEEWFDKDELKILMELETEAFNRYHG